MEKFKKILAHVLKILKWAFLVLIGAFIILVIIRIPHAINQQKTDAQIIKIHNTKLTIDDVMGKRLPPDPGVEADKTVQGIDANNNGIRDDVELAIFKEYPNSAKTRAVLLQNALAYQMETEQPFMNDKIAGEIANKEDRALFCTASIISDGGEGRVFTVVEKYGNFLKNTQLNTEIREKQHNTFYTYVKGGRIDESIECDIDLFTLPN